MTERNGRRTDPGQMAALALTNYGHFTTMAVAGLRVRGLSLHLERLVHDCRQLFGSELDPDRVRARVRDAVADTTGPVVVRVTVSDPGLALDRPAAAARPRILVTTRPAATGPLPPLRLRTVRYRRDAPRLKHTGLFGPLHQRRLAQLDGFDDALFTDARNAVSEGATWNIGFHDGDRLLWPDAECLPGVTMRLLRRAHSGPQATERVGADRLPGMRAAFVTNAAVGVRPVRAVDGVELDAGHPVLDALRAAYAGVPAERL